MKLNLLLTLSLSALTLPAAVIYQQNFESSNSVPAGFSGAGSIETTGGLSAFGFGSNHLFNGGTTETLFTLTGLAPHTSITLTFDLAVWDSVDGGSDIFSVMADNVSLFNGLFGNYDFEAGPGTFITAPFTNFSVPNYGQNSGFRDSARAVSFTFSHSATSLNLSWQYPNSQGASDESFGIDNIVISSDASENTVVPEPSTMALAGLALAALALKKRR